MKISKLKTKESRPVPAPMNGHSGLGQTNVRPMKIGGHWLTTLSFPGVPRVLHTLTQYRDATRGPAVSATMQASTVISLEKRCLKQKLGSHLKDY